MVEPISSQPRSIQPDLFNAIYYQQPYLPNEVPKELQEETACAAHATENTEPETLNPEVNPNATLNPEPRSRTTCETKKRRVEPDSQMIPGTYMT